MHKDSSSTVLQESADSINPIKGNTFEVLRNSLVDIQSVSNSIPLRSLNTLCSLIYSQDQKYVDGEQKNDNVVVCNNKIPKSNIQRPVKLDEVHIHVLLVATPICFIIGLCLALLTEPYIYTYIYTYIFIWIFYSVSLSVGIAIILFVKMVQARMIIVSVTLAYVLLSASYLVLEENINLEMAIKSFQNTQDLTHPSYKCKIQRDQIDLNILFEQQNDSFYHFIYGNHGVGKSDFLQNKSNTLPYVLYYSIEHNDDLPSSLYNVIFERERNLALKIFETTKDLVLKLKSSKINKENNLNFIYEFFRVNQAYIQLSLGTTPILILDNLNLYNTLTGFKNSLDNILSNAKIGVDTQSLRTILSSSEGSVGTLLPESSSGSRMKIHFMQDFTINATTQFLQCALRKHIHLLSDYQQNITYNLIYSQLGGQLINLINFIQTLQIKGNSTTSEILNIIAEDRYLDFVAIGIHLKTFTYDENKLSFEEFVMCIKYILELVNSEKQYINYSLIINKLKGRLPSSVEHKNLFKVTIHKNDELISFTSQIHKRKAKLLLGNSNGSRIQNVQDNLLNLYNYQLVY